MRRPPEDEPLLRPLPAPLPLSQALAQLIALRGYARVESRSQLVEEWSRIAGPEIAPYTRPLGVNRGVLQVAVANPVLLSELNGFHKSGLLLRLQQQRPELRIKDLKFRLQSGVRGSAPKSTAAPPETEEGSQSV